MKKSNDDLGDRMKMFEKLDSGRFLPCVPVCARLDGKGFSKYTKDMDRPFDVGFSELMQHVTKRLVEETNACIGYTQSDEITLIWYSDRVDSQIFFDGKKQKMISVLASMATAFFNDHWFTDDLPIALFDCRVWSVPTKQEAVNILVWRENDATKNSVSMATRSVYSHKQMMNKNGSEMQDMLMDKGINWNDYPSEFKRGSYFQRKTFKRKLTPEEIDELPEKHTARQNPDMDVIRSKVVKIDIPPITKVINRCDVVFNGDEPKMKISDFSEKGC